MDYFELTKTRKSIREFKDLPVSEKQIAEIEAYFKECRYLAPEIAVELEVICHGAEEYLKDGAGYQGLSFEAPCYLLLLSQAEKAYIENAGYINESLMLKVTSMGLDSCWLTVNDGEAIKEAMKLHTDRQVVTAMAIGYGYKERPTLRAHIKTPSNVEFITREGHVAPKISLSELVFEQEWNKIADLSEERIDTGLRKALQAASFAPAFLNRQSYRFIMDGGVLVLVKILDSLTGELDALLNCGAVMFNFAAVLSQYRPHEIAWVLAKPEKTYNLPGNCKIIGYCNI